MQSNRVRLAAPARNVAMWTTLVVALLTLGGLGGCGSVSASTAINDATRDLHEAKEQKAPEFAVYYYTRADTYLQKAKELNGMGQFQVAAEYARTSQDASEKALGVARTNRDQAARREKFAPKKSDREKNPMLPGERE